MGGNSSDGRLDSWSKTLRVSHLGGMKNSEVYLAKVLGPICA